ncbi:DUF1963 domain-containing protein [Phycicoccus flavus]
MPSTGRLLLFYDVQEMPWGFDPADRVGWLLLHDDTPEDDLAPVEPPAVLRTPDPDGVLPELPLTATAARTLPEGFTPAVEDALGASDRDAYREWWVESMDRAFFDTHRVGGRPSQVQGEMTVECALGSAGHSTGDSSAYDDEEVLAAAQAEAPEWRLVLQVASDDDRGFMWGDSGFLFV